MHFKYPPFSSHSGSYNSFVSPSDFGQPIAQHVPIHPLRASVDDHLWGYLQPCTPQGNLLRIDFLSLFPAYTIGRDLENDIVLPAIEISKCQVTSGLDVNTDPPFIRQQALYFKVEW